MTQENAWEIYCKTIKKLFKKEFEELERKGKEMERKVIEVQYPQLNHTESIANICIDKTAVFSGDKININDAFSNKNNSLFIVILFLYAFYFNHSGVIEYFILFSWQYFSTEVPSLQ